MTPAEIEAERLRFLEEQYGSLSFWRTIGRALWQGVSLGWGDEAVAWYESQRRGTSYEEEWQRQMAVNGALASVDPAAWAAAEFAGSAAWNAPFLFGPLGAARGIAALRNAALLNGATGGVSLAGSGGPGNRLQRFALGAVTGAPLGFVGGGYTQAWPGISRTGQFLTDSALTTAPTMAFQAQIPGSLGAW